MYIFTKSNNYFGQAAYGNSKVIIFVLGFILVFYLLYYEFISIRMVLNCITSAGAIFLAIIVLFYLKNGGLRVVLSERIGTSIDIGPNTIAMALDMIFPVTFFSALYCKRNIITKTALFLLSFLYLIVLFLTYSRGSIFGLIALGVFLVFHKIKLHKIAIFMVILLLSLTVWQEGIFKRFNAQDRAVMESNFDRVVLLQSAMKMIRENHIIFGNGMLTFSLAKYDYSFPKWADKQKGLSTHSLYVEHFVGLGLFGMLGISSMLFGTLFSLVRLKVPDSNEGIKFGLLFSLLSCMLHGFVDCQVGNPAFSLPLLAILACSAILKYRNGDKPRNQPESV